MEHAYGWLAIIPPIIAVVLALRTKEVLGSLIAGIFSGYFIYVNFAPTEIAEGLASTNPIIGPVTEMVKAVISNAGDSWNMAILIFLALIGGLVAVVTVAGGSAAYGEWAASKVKSRSGAQMSTFMLGCIIFIDDYFNSLTVGTVMRPLTDRYKVSRAKLAYILDSTAAPVTILVPISSWVAYVISVIQPTLQESGFELSGLNGFMATIPFNIYAWLSLVMVVLVAMSQVEFGPMAQFENYAMETGELQGDSNATPPGDDFSNLKISSKGTPWDLIIPISGLIIFTMLAMVYTGGFFGGGVSLWHAFGDTDAATSLVYGGIAALLLCMVMFIPRKLMTYGEFMEAFTQGVKSMVPAFTILILAWTFGSVLRDDGLQSGSFVANLVGNSIPVQLLPAIIFIVSGAIAFSTGTSWGTFAIMLPIAIPLSGNLNPEMIGLMMSAVLAGAVFGDHCSPISDTTILSSTGAACHHLDHVSTQIPYALTVAGVSVIGFIIGGLTNSAYLSLGVSGIILVVVAKTITKISRKRNQQNVIEISRPSMSIIWI
ncbi:Na+/H+ antiporter NhaC family protein [Alkaliphilus hydrothermalis]|uniref:Na+/H+ antiporter NhaC n=1 Tax=Alkaliphilus hydrothermalis TaxID=1482730 RepID=A0ABS2NRD9_9FIRM|nr:Na+/H+ antiporter NhaC family protein [Alkaliphilus hydrothermalis]MBM7615491.1 Na+/H+ antiporter NhaC [Alkaliphilus hydrothermalis]